MEGEGVEGRGSIYVFGVKPILYVRVDRVGRHAFHVRISLPLTGLESRYGLHIPYECPAVPRSSCGKR